MLQVECGTLTISCLLMTASMADLEEVLCRLVEEFGRVCSRRKLKVNAGKGNEVYEEG